MATSLLKRQAMTGSPASQEALDLLWQGVAANPAAHTLARMDFSIIYANDTALDLWGHKDQSEVTVKPPIDFWADRRAALKFSKQVLTKGEHTGDLVAKRVDGTLGNFRLCANVIRGKEGEPLGILGVYFDVSDATARERALEASEERFKDIAELSADYIWETDSNHRLTFLTAGFEKVLGVPRETCYGRMFWELMERLEEAGGKAEGWEPLSEALEQQIACRDLQMTLAFPDGRRLDVSCSGKPILDENGAYIGFRGAARDVTRQSEAERKILRQSYVMQGMADGVWIIDGDGIVLDVNPAVTKIFGWARDYVVGKLVYDLWREAEVEGLDRDTIVAALETEGFWRGEFQFVRLDGSGDRVYVDQLTFPVRDEATGGVGRVSIARDVTVQKTAQEDLKRIKERYDLAAQYGKTVVWEATPERDEFIAAGDSVLLPIDDETQGGTLLFPRIDAFHPDDAAKMRGHVADFLSGKSTEATVEARVPDPDGSTRWMLVHTNVVSPPGERPIRLIGTTRDITEQKEAEIALRQSEQRYALAANYGETTVWEAVPERNEFLATGDSVSLPIDDALKASNLFFERFEVFHPEDKSKMRAAVEDLVEGRATEATLEARIPLDDETTRWLLIHTNVVTAPGERPVRLIGTTRDITAQKEAELAQYRSERRLARAQETAGLGNWELDLKTQMVVLSSEMYRIHDIDPAVEAVPLSDLLGDVHLADQEALGQGFYKAATEGRTFSGEYRLVTRAGNEKTVRGTAEVELDDAGAPTRLLGTTLDITEMRQTERQLQQAQKMETVGQLSAGVAHDFNNLLAIIIGNLEILGDMTDEDAELGDLVGEARAAATRGADLTKRLLAFSSLQTLFPRPTNVNRLLEDVSQLLKRTIGQQVDVIVDDAADLWVAHVDGAQLESAILNLAINARDAMPEGGTLTMRTKNLVVDGQEDEGERGLSKTDYVCIEISDTGKGITPEILDRAIEPFFTSKPLGQGSGLGLSMVYGFTRQSGGDFRIESEPGAGTTIQLLLPRALGDEAEWLDPTAEAAVADGAGRRVLAVEDDPHVLNVVVKQLDALGYEVDVATSGEQALEMLRSSDPPFDVMLADVVLGRGIDGVQLAAKARASFPELNILCMSGYADRTIVSQAEGEVELSIIAKPFTKNQLRERLELLFAD